MLKMVSDPFEPFSSLDLWSLAFSKFLIGFELLLTQSSDMDMSSVPSESEDQPQAQRKRQRVV